MTARLPLMTSVIIPLAKRGFFLTIWIISSNVSNRCSYSKENLWSGTTALIISNEEMEDIMKIFKSFEESRLLIKRIRGNTKNKAK